MKKFLGLSLIAGLAACAPGGGLSSSTTTALNTAVADGQLFCSVASQYGPMVVAVVNAANAKAVTVTGQTSQYVATACALIKGIPVVPPGNPATVPAVAVVMPPPA